MSYYYPNCSYVYSQRYNDRDTGWVCTAKAEIVKIVFWIFILLILLSFFNTLMTTRQIQSRIAYPVEFSDTISDTTSDAEEHVPSSSQVNRNNK